MPFTTATDPDRLDFERWAGPVADADIATYNSLLTLYGEAYAVALQVLMRDRASAAKRAGTSVASGADRIARNRQNPEALDELVDELVAFMLDCLDDLNLTAEGLRLLKSAATGPTEETIIVRTNAGNVRRG